MDWTEGQRHTALVWWGRQESNLQPVDYEPNALTIELRPRHLSIIP